MLRKSKKLLMVRTRLPEKKPRRPRKKRRLNNRMLLRRPRKLLKRRKRILRRRKRRTLLPLMKLLNNKMLSKSSKPFKRNSTLRLIKRPKNIQRN